MSIVGIAAIVLAIVGASCVVGALGQIWAVGGRAEDPVGPWRTQVPFAPPPPPIPRDLNSLIWGETSGWQRPEQWEALLFRLDRLETELGGTPPTELPPPIYSEFWLDQRLERIEALAGPLPGEMPTHVPTPSNQRWKK